MPSIYLSFFVRMLLHLAQVYFDLGYLISLVEVHCSLLRCYLDLFIVLECLMVSLLLYAHCLFIPE